MINNENPFKCPTCRHTVAEIDKVELLPNNVHAEHIILLNIKLQKAEAETKMLVSIFMNFVVCSCVDNLIFLTYFSIDLQSCWMHILNPKNQTVKCLS